MLHFNIRIVRNGDKYGLNDCLTHDASGSMIEFYDPRYPHTNLGQFISRYYVQTLLAARRELSIYGFCLDNSISDWNVSGEQMVEIFNTIDNSPPGIF